MKAISSTTNVKTKMHTELLQGNLNRRYHMGDLAVYGMVMLKR